MPIYVDPTTFTAVSGAYCTVEQARAAGAAGDDPTVLAAITEASDAVDRYTRSVFDQRLITVETDVGSDGYARLPLPVLSIDSVTYADLPGFAGALPATAYTLSQSSRPGDTDSLRLVGGAFGWAGGLDTVVGMESYRRGQAAPSYERRRLVVTGTFGRTSVPASVQRATALIAAAITGGGGASEVNAEGDVDLPPRVPSIGAEDGAPASTGVAAADQLLRTHRRGLVRIS